MEDSDTLPPDDDRDEVRNVTTKESDHDAPADDGSVSDLDPVQDGAESPLDQPKDPALDEASQPFEGQWNLLISTTNWEKGRIILHWRSALIEAGAPPTAYSDDAWASRVGGITGQHVGRLRRVHQRFGQAYRQYEGLYWSHFHAALDWDDAEMWLEGAVRSDWSVSRMRKTRWETLGATPELKPRDEDIIVAEINEDVETSERGGPGKSSRAAARGGDEQSGPRADGPDFGDEDEGTSGASGGASIFSGDKPGEVIDFVRPFENLGELPEDLSESFESFKLAILRHKANRWEEIARDDVLACLDALKELALAPSAT